MKTHSIDLRVQRPFTRRASASSPPTRSSAIGSRTGSATIEQYQVLQSGGESGWEWQPTNPSLPEHRMTGGGDLADAGRPRPGVPRRTCRRRSTTSSAAGSTRRRCASTRDARCSSPTRYAVSGNPKLDNPTRDRWFDTSMFAAQPAFTPRTNPVFYDGLNGPGAWFVDMTMTKSFPIGHYRLEARVEAYNALNHIVWDQPDTTFGERATSARSRASGSTATAARSRSACGSCSECRTRRALRRDAGRGATRAVASTAASRGGSCFARSPPAPARWSRRGCRASPRAQAMRPIATTTAGRIRGLSRRRHQRLQGRPLRRRHGDAAVPAAAAAGAVDRRPRCARVRPDRAAARRCAAGR